MEGKGRRERNISVGCPSHTHNGALDLASNPGMCPDWESGKQPFGFQASAQSTEPHQPGPSL